jgi:putative ABC transport system permease protein
MLGRLLAGLRGFLRRKRIEAEIDEEVQFHLEMEIQANIERGMPPHEARRVALRDLGGVTQTKEAVRDVRTIWLDSIWQDVRYAFRSFGRNPGFTATAVATLALGIGLNTGLFSIVNAVLIRPLPFPEADRLVSIGGIPTPAGSEWFDSRVFESMAHYSVGSADLTDVDDATKIPACQVSPAFLATLGVSPHIGRDFRADDGPEGANHVAIISDGLWKRQFGGRPDVIGRTVRLTGKNHDIIGVAAPDFGFPGATDVWVPSDFLRRQWFLYRRPDKTGPSNGTIARLRLGTSIERALAVARAGERNWEDRSRKKNSSTRTAYSYVGLRPLHESLVREARRSLLVLFGAVGFVLVVACANIANMLLARGALRRQEIAIRASIGAGRARLLRQLLTESVLLASVGGVAGMFVAAWTVRFFDVLAPANFPALAHPILDVRVLGFTLLASFLAGTLGGLAPSWQLARQPAVHLQPGRHSAFGRPRRRTRRLLIAIQVAASIVLLTGAGLMARTLLVLQNTDLGFQPENVLTMEITSPLRLDVPRDERFRQFQAAQRDLLERMRPLPGAHAAAAADQLPMDPGGGGYQFFDVRPRTAATPPADQSALTTSVTSLYFNAMGIRLLKGRTFSEQDVVEDRPVAIVNDVLAARYWPGESAIGKQIKAPEDWLEVVGVVSTVKFVQASDVAAPQIYVPGHGTFFVLRTSSPEPALAAVVRAEARRMDKNAVISRVRPLSDLVNASIASPRSRSLLLGGFGALALLLAAVGIFGVVSCLVAERAHEIGVRVTLGARNPQVARMIVWQAAMPVFVGAVGGITGALATTRLLRSFLFGVQAVDPATFVFASCAAAAVAILAAYLPARRATSIDPIAALRCE